MAEKMSRNSMPGQGMITLGMINQGMITLGIFLPAVIALMVVLGAPPARAEDDCVAVLGIGPEIDRFLDQAVAAQAAGAGVMPITDVLFGVTEISPEDQQDLARRPPVELTRRTANGGDYVSRGPGRITVEGVFAERDTLFRLPELIVGRYRLTEEGATLHYDPAHTVDVGESMLGINFFMSVNHTEISKDKLAFFFEDNDGDEPDRCYLVVRGG